ncbi:M48 family metalloprotease [Metabacillus idriensis]|uniref:M48 family metallopeptidase n=1 Tax=Metabacillus idriensis TaxID=324768 RepID=UPI002814024F|nr:M48 family metalloprotease [Metabacillus idriensis]MDR0136124.1 M48 family metalloprotease [Metabacillus idriensis]
MSEHIHRKEHIYFIILLLISIPMYLLFIFTGVGLLILIPFILIPLIAHLLSIGMIRGNGVKVTPSQFPEIYAKVNDLAVKMEMKKLPDIFIIESEGMLNAFATRFLGRNMVVLYSGLAELHVKGGKEELDFVIAHELAHIKRNHLLKNLLVLFGNWVPFLGSAYSRACEYTCDALAHYYTEDLDASKRALTVLAIGPVLYKYVNETDYLQESSREKNLFVWFSEKVSTHPVLPKRIHHLNGEFGESDPSISFRTTALFKAGLAGAFALILLIGAGSVFLVQMLAKTSLYSNFVLDSEETTQLMLAASENDLERAEELIESGEDVNAQDSLGMTPLMYASYPPADEYEEELIINAEMVELLLKNGADPNIVSDNGDVATVDIIYSGDLDLAELLIEKNADINLEDGYGQTALIAAVYEEDVKMVELLLNAGADPDYATSEDETARSIAEEIKVPEITALLNK